MNIYTSTLSGCLDALRQLEPGRGQRADVGGVHGGLLAAERACQVS